MNLLEFKNKNVNEVREEAQNIEVVKHPKKVDDVLSHVQKILFEDAIERIEKIVGNDGKVKDFELIQGKTLRNYTIVFSNDGRYIHIKDINTDYIYGVISLGNKKLVSNEFRLFIIFNVLQRICCPNATKNCLKFCYANKSNNNVNVKGSNSRNSRIKNTILSMFDNFDSIINEVLEFLRTYTQRELIFRFHESGDIYSPIYWNKIKNVLKNNKDVSFMFYTKSVFVLNEMNEVNQLPNVALRYSLDSSTSLTLVKKCYDENHLTFIATDNVNIEDTIETVGNVFICNTLKVDHRETIEKIRELTVAMEQEKRKTYKKEFKKEINKLRNAMINKNQKCTNCMKCLNKNNISLFVGIH